MKIARFIGAVTLFLVAIEALLFMSGRRDLTSEEIALATTIFADSIDYDRVRLREGRWLTKIYPAYTVGNTVTFPAGAYSIDDVRDRALLIHELAHVWQFQNFGPGYLPRAVFEEVTQSDAYVIHFDAAKSLRAYDVEEQAEIAAEYYLTQDARFAPYIDEFVSP